MLGALRDLVPLVQFKKREKHPWRNVTFSKVGGWRSVNFSNFTKINTPPPCTLLKVTLLHGCFSHFLTYTNVIRMLPNRAKHHMSEAILELVNSIRSKVLSCSKTREVTRITNLKQSFTGKKKKNSNRKICY